MPTTMTTRNACTTPENSDSTHAEAVVPMSTTLAATAAQSAALGAELPNTLSSEYPENIYIYSMYIEDLTY
jgi:hypothetical protein